jgi:mannose-1-phosphate guanylyltransferase / mannose-6-phosphate isomerase
MLYEPLGAYMNNHLYAVILAGGSGTRFWPLSRESYPKQLLKLVGPETMLQRTMAVARKVTDDPDRVCIVTHELQADAVRLQLDSHNTPHPSPVLLEPVARNTAPAIGLAASEIYRKDRDALLVVMPADHVIRKMGPFVQAIKKACRVADQGFLVTFGIKPSRPETGFGYIKAGARHTVTGRKKVKDVYRVKRFVEKPDTATAKRYLREGGYYWNSGIFVFKAIEILKAIRKHLPSLGKGLHQMDQAGGMQGKRDVIKRIYQDLPSVSIDNGVMERMESGRIAVIATDMGWSDVGSWSALQEILPINRKGNIVRGNVIEVDCRDSVLYGDRRPVAVIGAESMVVVDTPDATLVCPKDRAQEVRSVVEVLKKRQSEEQKTPKTVERPWGSFTVLEEGEGYKIKRILVKPGARLSLQLHRKRSEHWVVVQGVARVTRNKEVFDVKTHQSTYIPRGAKHRIQNPGREPLQVIEVQNGDYLGEDDIVRFQDDYWRVIK